MAHQAETKDGDTLIQIYEGRRETLYSERKKTREGGGKRGRCTEDGSRSAENERKRGKERGLG